MMRQSLTILFLAIFYFGVTAQCYAAQPTVVEVLSVDAPTAGVGLVNTHISLSPDVQVHLASYHCTGITACVPDGGEGLLLHQGTGTGCSASNTDGGSTFYDADGHCWYRQNLNGDLRQWGLTQNSDYDSIWVLTHPGHTQKNATDIVQTAFTVLGGVGITTLHTRQVNIKIGLSVGGARLQIPTGSSLTCDAPPTKDSAGADFSQIRGSLIIAHGTSGSANYIDASSNSNAEISGCAALLPEWYIVPSAASAFNGYVRSNVAPDRMKLRTGG